METVVSEHSLDIIVDGQLRVGLCCSPRYLKELAVGYLYSSGSIRSIADIKSLSPDREYRTVRAETSCFDIPLEPVEDGLSVPLGAINKNMEQFLRGSEVFKETGAVHSCALSVEGELLHFMEDIGRHNAYDKTIGSALLEDTGIGRAAALTSGRLPGDMLIKLIYSRVPIVLSRSAPTDEAVDLAKRYNITLCGFARAGRINIYTGGSRINF
jgi:FdhD protein